MSSSSRRKPSVNIHYHSFKGTENLIGKIENMGKNGRRIVVYFDPDIDGVFAGYFVCKFLSKLGKSFSWYINSNRDHGFSIPLEKLKNTDIIAVDFLIEPMMVKKIVDAGCSIISMDHHVNINKLIEYETESNYGVVINNQYGFEEESSRYLSGAGVVFETLVGLDPSFNTRENRAIVGITLLSDIRDIENPNARGYLEELYNHPYKGYIKYLIDNTIGDVDYTFGVPRLDRNYIDFTFSPILNSCFRFNKEDMVVEFVLGSGFIDKSYHTLQKELVEDIYSKSKTVDFDSLRVVIINGNKFNSDIQEVLGNFVGLTASQFLDTSHSAIAYMVLDGNIKRASFRGRINGLKYQDKLNKILNGVGHESAFGIKNLNPSMELFKEANELCRVVDSSSNYKEKIVRVNNLSFFVQWKGYEIGLENCYCLSQNRTYLKYTGSNIKKKRFSGKFIEYDIDGVSVLCFDKELDPKKDLFLPICERNNLCLYLNNKYIIGG